MTLPEILEMVREIPTVEKIYATIEPQTGHEVIHVKGFPDDELGIKEAMCHIGKFDDGTWSFGGNTGHTSKWEIVKVSSLDYLRELVWAGLVPVGKCEVGEHHA